MIKVTPNYGFFKENKKMKAFLEISILATQVL